MSFRHQATAQSYPCKHRTGSKRIENIRLEVIKQLEDDALDDLTNILWKKQVILDWRIPMTIPLYQKIDY